MPDGRDTELLQVRDKGKKKPGCFCGSERSGNAGFCYDCYIQLPDELTALLWPKPQLMNDYDFDGVRAQCRDYLKSLGVKDAEEESYGDILAGLPEELQLALIGEI